MGTLYQDQGMSMDLPPSDLTAAPSSGLGLAPASGPDPLRAAVDAAQPAQATSLGQRTRDFAQQENEGKSTAWKVGKFLSEYGAGARGEASPMAQRMEAARKDKLAQIETLKETTSALEHGVKLAQGMEGDSRTKFIESYAGSLDSLDKGLGDTFKAVADRPDIVTNIASLMPYLPEPMRLQAKLDTQGFLKTLGTEAGLKALDHAKNQFGLRTATAKAQSLLAHAQQFGIPNELIAEYQKNPTASVFRKMEQAASDPRVKLSSDEQAAINSSPDIFYGPLGMMTPKGEEAIREDKAKKGTPSAADIENARHHRELEKNARDKIDQEKFSNPIEVSIEGKNTMVRQDKKTGKILDPNGVDVTDKIAPQIKGSPLDPGRVSMALQAHADVMDARRMIFDKDGNLNRSVIAAMDVPGTKGVGTEGRKAYSAIENAVAAKLRGETGAATNPGEIENTAARFRPTLMDTQESAKYKLDRLQEFMGMTLDQLKESYHISQETYDKAKNRGKDAGGGEPLAMPAEKSKLVPNQAYITSRGVATWDGTKFVLKKK